MAMHHTVVLIPGDGIGPEVSSAVCQILNAAGAPLEFEEHQAGQAALQAGSKQLLPDETVRAIRTHKVALKGPCTTPIASGHRSVNVALRQTLNLFAAVRPVRSMPGVTTRYADVDIVIVRENTEGLYSGLENVITEDVVVSLKVATRTACARIAHWAFRYAVQRKRRRITVLHKANIMKITDGMFLEEARKARADYAGIDSDEVIIDAAAMRLVRDSAPFDVILCENLYGDIMSDLCAGLVGGLGVAPGANFGDDYAVFESVHGSAPDIAGQNRANPLALLMSAVMLLNHLASVRSDPACADVATRIRTAYDRALAAGETTVDLGGTLGTREFAAAVISRLL
jgi:isocitrate dehydrogenase (NAD+)